VAKAVEHALARPTLNLAAVAMSANLVRASTGFRNSPVLAPFREWGLFDFYIRQENVGWMVTVASDLRVTRQNNSADLRRAKSDEVSAYETRIREEIVNWVASACAQLRTRCDISR
jgi:hypothetical protein